MIRKLRLIIFVNALFFLCTLSTFAQDIQWDTSPRKGFVFQISNKEANKLLTRSSPDTIFNGLLHTLIDTFNVKKGWINRPAKGHFILATINENRMYCEYTSVFPYQVFLMKEYDALSLQVLDLEGNVRQDARVKFRYKRLRIDSESKTYRLANEWVNGDKVVTVELDGFLSVFNIQKHDVPTWYNNYSDRDGPTFYSYMITDKNKYKPNEKVRFKSYALSQSRSPLRKDLDVLLITHGKSIKIGNVTPHRPGSYASEFYLHDSLKLTLDKTYTVQLLEKNGRVVAQSNFRYEDYELLGNKLDVHLATNRHFYPAKNELSIQATDMNGLVLKDAKASIVVKTQSIRETFQPLVILRDTLFATEVNLNPVGATVVDIPSHLFQKTNTSYSVHVTVINSQNQRMEMNAAATHYYEKYELTAHLSNDSIVYNLLSKGLAMNDVPMRLKHNGEVEGKEVRLPYKEKLNPVVSSVYLQGDVASREISMRTLAPELNAIGGIQKDSFKIALHNPQKLEVSWYLYQGSALLQKGFGKEMDYKTLITDRETTFYVELLYSFGGIEQISRQEYEFREDYLDVSFEVPERVYPGQKVEATIHVLDQLGNPVKGVDLTALAVTAKLNYDLDDLPYYGNSSAPRSKRAHYSKQGIDKRAALLNLDYNRWKKPAGLDTMKYYQFTYPGSSVFKHSVAIDDSTQFAPFVMQRGSATKIYVIEVNRKPVYYSWTEQPKGYSFYVSPHQKNEISLRLHDRVLVFDSLVFKKGTKTILSIDLDNLPGNITVHKFNPVVTQTAKNSYVQHYEFTTTERNRHSQYIAAFKSMEGNVYLESGQNFTPLFHPRFPTHKESIAVGPIEPGKQTYTNHYYARTTYRHSGGFLYSFEDNLVYMLTASWHIPYSLPESSLNPMAVINDKMITKKMFLEPHQINTKWVPRVIDLADHALRMSVLLPLEKQPSGVASLLFQNNATQAIVSPCQNQRNGQFNFFTIPRGNHHAIVLYNNGTYLKMNDIELTSYTNVMVDLTRAPLHSVDSLSRAWLVIPSNNCYNTTAQIPTDRTMYLRYATTGNGNVKGTIYDEINQPIPGANIVVKGTANGTTADVDGKFSININDLFATLVVSFIGYQTKEIEIQRGAHVTVYLDPDIQQLQEVVVVGYGSQRKSDMVGAVAMLKGKIAGIAIESPDTEEEEEEEEEESQENKIIEEAEKRLYQELLTLKSIRSNFSDVGFWEPKLFTDKQGQSKFSITFPDDITRWDATIYAMNRYLQTGTARKSIKSFKPLMAELHVPQFLTQGDSAFFLGKVLNYTHDKNISGKIRWSGADSDFDKSIQFGEFYIDKLPVTPATTDSITAQYRFTRDDGYTDGEERTVPVVEQGVVRADGTFTVLKSKEEILIKALKGETVTIEILNTPLDIYIGEVNYLLDYKYACNEQLASKLLGLINHKILMQYEGKEFRFDKDVNKIIARLLKNQNQEFLWSWWNVSPGTSYWMSAHILRALKTARNAGYDVSLDIENIARKAEYKFDILHNYSMNDIELLNALASWNAKLNYKKYIAELDSAVWRKQTLPYTISGNRYYYRFSLLKEKLLLQETRQLTHTAYQRDSVLLYKREAVLGDVHFSDEKPAAYWYDDNLAANTIAYRIVKRDSLLTDLIEPMQAYFLKQRRNGTWNTYHSSTVLTEVLPDLLAQGVSKGNSGAVKLSGKVNNVLSKFPYRVELKQNEELRIQKESGSPTYCMQYTKERITKAKTGLEGFEIKTSFDRNNNKTLEAGKPAILNVEVNVTKEASAEYVMIEVPIPAACSYADKTQRYNGIETHREYYKERTAIFCENLVQGKYTFQIHLLPRFTGTYFVNPAQISLMYVPVVNANTEMKVVRVE